MDSHTMPKKKIFLEWLILAALGLWAAISLVRIIQNTIAPSGANDLYTYWYAGHFVRQADDPYKAFLSEQLPDLPVHYLDRTATSIEEIILPGLVPAPGNTYPLFFLFSSFAFLSWSKAKILWLAFNLILIGIIPALVIRLLPRGERLEVKTRYALHFAFIGLASTRYAASSGQSTFLIFAFILGAVLLTDKKPYLAGILLGLALTKYSLSIGFFLYYLFIERKWRLVITAALLQVAGVIGLMLMSGSAALEILHEYMLMFKHHAIMSGIHLASLIPFNDLDLPIAAVLTLVVALPLIVWYRRLIHSNAAFRPSPLDRFHLFTIISLWSLLVGYHRAYDVIVFIIFLALILLLMSSPKLWHLTRHARIGVMLFTFASTILLMAPAGSLVRTLIHGSLGSIWTAIVDRMITFILLASLISAFFLLFHTKDNYVNFERSKS
jgi:hypothetical protein